MGFGIKETEGKIYFKYFFEGDCVLTPMGVGVVHEDEETIHDEEGLRCSEVLVQHEMGCSENTSNRPIGIGRAMISKISDKAYKNYVKGEERFKR